MFKVRAKGYSQEFDRWIDALDAAKALMPNCGWFNEVQILDKDDLVWAYSRGYKYPRFIGPGTYDRLAKRFILESTLEVPPDTPLPEADQLELFSNFEPMFKPTTDPATNPTTDPAVDNPSDRL
jgi:hypothetical protein